MRFGWRRRVDAMTLDDIDNEIDAKQAEAQTLVASLKATLEEQNVLLRQLREGRGDEPAGAAD